MRTCVRVDQGGSPYARFQRSLQTRKLSVVLAAAAELDHMQLDDALEVLILMALERDPRFDRAATRWVGRLLAEQPLGLADARFALALVERLPQCRETLHRLARGNTAATAIGSPPPGARPST